MKLVKAVFILNLSQTGKIFRVFNFVFISVNWLKWWTYGVNSRPNLLCHEYEMAGIVDLYDDNSRTNLLSYECKLAGMVDL